MEDPALVAHVEAAIQDQVMIVGELSDVASKHPYYKYKAPIPHTYPCDNTDKSKVQRKMVPHHPKRHQHSPLLRLARRPAHRHPAR